MNKPTPYEELRECARQIRWSKRIFSVVFFVDALLAGWLFRGTP